MALSTTAQPFLRLDGLVIQILVKTCIIYLRFDNRKGKPAVRLGRKVMDLRQGCADRQTAEGMLSGSF